MLSFMMWYGSCREILEHSNVTFNDNGTLSSIPLHPLQWQPELSHPLKEDDLLILPHIAALVSYRINL